MILYVLILSLAIVIFNLTLPMMAGLYIVSDLGGNAYLAPYGVSFFVSVTYWVSLWENPGLRV